MRRVAALLRSTRAPWALAVALLGLAALPASGLGGAALRGLAVLGALALAAAALRRRAPAVAGALVAARQPLGRDSGLAVVDLPGRRVLVGWSAAGVALLADLPREERP